MTFHILIAIIVTFLINLVSGQFSYRNDHAQAQSRHKSSNFQNNHMGQFSYGNDYSGIPGAQPQSRYKSSNFQNNLIGQIPYRNGENGNLNANAQPGFSSNNPPGQNPYGNGENGNFNANAQPGYSSNNSPGQFGNGYPGSSDYDQSGYKFPKAPGILPNSYSNDPTAHSEQRFLPNVSPNMPNNGQRGFHSYSSSSGSNSFPDQQRQDVTTEDPISNILGFFDNLVAILAETPEPSNGAVTKASPMPSDPGVSPNSPSNYHRKKHPRRKPHNRFKPHKKRKKMYAKTMNSDHTSILSSNSSPESTKNIPNTNPISVTQEPKTSKSTLSNADVTATSDNKDFKKTSIKESVIPTAKPIQESTTDVYKIDKPLSSTVFSTTSDYATKESVSVNSSSADESSFTTTTDTQKYTPTSGGNDNITTVVNGNNTATNPDQKLSSVTPSFNSTTSTSTTLVVSEYSRASEVTKKTNKKNNKPKNKNNKPKNKKGHRKGQKRKKPRKKKKLRKQSKGNYPYKTNSTQITTSVTRSEEITRQITKASPSSTETEIKSIEPKTTTQVIASTLSMSSAGAEITEIPNKSSTKAPQTTVPISKDKSTAEQTTNAPFSTTCYCPELVTFVTTSNLLNTKQGTTSLPTVRMKSSTKEMGDFTVKLEPVGSSTENTNKTIILTTQPTYKLTTATGNFQESGGTTKFQDLGLTSTAVPLNTANFTTSTQQGSSVESYGTTKSMDSTTIPSNSARATTEVAATTVAEEEDSDYSESGSEETKTATKENPRHVTFDESYYETEIPPQGVTCREKERYYKCAPSCRQACFNHNNYEVPCPDVCMPGCFCDPGLVVDEEGNCVHPSECKESCNWDEEWWECMPENHNTCENYVRAYARKDFNCKPGCFCMKGLVKNKDGKCVEPDDCLENFQETDCYQENERYVDCLIPCNLCEANCHSCNLLSCVDGCDCKDGYKRNSNGTCISAHMCPPCPSPAPMSTSPSASKETTKPYTSSEGATKAVTSEKTAKDVTSEETTKPYTPGNTTSKIATTTTNY